MNAEDPRFQQLDDANQRKLIAAYKETSEALFRESRNASWELAKFLFAANGGSAAGLFVLVQSSPGNPYLIAAFSTFCLGVFFVGAAYFLGTWMFNRVALEWEVDVEKVLVGEISPMALRRRQRSRVRGWWGKFVQLFGTLSFLCLCAGGIVALKPFLVSHPPAATLPSPSVRP